MNFSTEELQKLTLYDLLNTMVSRIPDENPTDYFDRMYDVINPGMIMEAVEEAKRMVQIESDISRKSKKKKEHVNVYLTLGGDSLNKSFYTGVIAGLMWLPNYIKEVGQRMDISNQNIDTTLNTLKECKLPQIHDVKEEIINDTKVSIKPSGVKHYSAFLGSIVSWLSNGVTNFQVKGTMKTNMEMCRYLTSAALNSFPSVPFCSYHIGSIDTLDIFKLSEKFGKSFDWTKYMSNDCYMLNEPKFVVTTSNAPIVGIVGHPLTETFIAEIKEGQAKWVGLFIETEEFAKICANNGLTAEMIKKYIIGTSEKQHNINVNQKDPIALFIESQKITKQCFEWRHKYSSVKLDDELKDAYDI
jgi:hypothetical protein